MDPQKLGRRIARRRKALEWTQTALAEQLGITPQTLAAWEAGNALPDAAGLAALCDKLGVSPIALLDAPRAETTDEKEREARILLSLVAEKRNADRRARQTGLVIAALAAALFFVTVVLPAFLLMPDALRVVLILLGLSCGVTALLFAPRFMQTAEPRKCPTCGRTFLPSRGWLLISALRNRSRQTPCPACRKKARRKTRTEKAPETKTKP